MEQETIKEEQDMDLMADMTPEEAKAALGLSTRLSEQFLMSQMPQEGMGMEEPTLDASQEAKMPQGKEMGKEMMNGEGEDMEALIEQKVASAIQKEIGGIREEIRKYLKEDEEDEEDETTDETPEKK